LFVKKLVLDIAFPPRCAVCDAVLPVGYDRGACRSCMSKLSYVTEPQCLKCGKEIMSYEDEYCDDCRRETRSFVRCYPLLNYIPPVSDALAKLKYHGRAEYADFYGRLMAEYFGNIYMNIPGACFVPVPVSRQRLHRRGYNQAELIALAISEYTAVETRSDILVRSKDTKAQKKLSRSDRAKNLRHAFEVKPGTDIPEAVILVDDIYTTGATLEACTQVLLRAGVRRVYATTVCVGKV